ncbi:hypothetical protein Drorol1_Dr00002165 [Drosera rotundifolia]
MTQKVNQFKGQQKRRTIPPNRHGRAPITRKGSGISVPLIRRLVLVCGSLFDWLSLIWRCVVFGVVGKRVVKPSKISKELDADCELTKFINHCKEIKAATVACKEGGHLRIVKPPKEAARNMNTAEEAD